MYFPEAKNWMWNYCLYLGEYEDNGERYDLGVYIHPKRKDDVSFAIVYGPEDGQYISGPIENAQYFLDSKEPRHNAYRETIKRYQEFKLI